MGRLVRGGRSTHAGLARPCRNPDPAQAAFVPTVITPRRTQLLRTADLRTFRSAIAESIAGSPSTNAVSRAVVVPSRAAALQLERTLDARGLEATLVTRDGLYSLLAGRLTPPPRRLTPF